MVTVKKPTEEEVKNLSKKQLPNLFEKMKENNKKFKERLELLKQKSNKQ